METWNETHLWEGDWLPPSCDVLVLELFIFKLTFSFCLLLLWTFLSIPIRKPAEALKVSNHPSGNTFQIQSKPYSQGLD